MLKILMVLCGLNAPTQAQTTPWEQLRQSFEPVLAQAQVEFQRAQNMLPRVVERGPLLTPMDCKAIQNRIRSNYRIDPFHFVFTGGSSSNFICGGPDGSALNYLAQISGFSNFGLPYSQVIQLEDNSVPSLRGLTQYFLDTSLRVVEMQGLFFDPQTNALVGYGLTAIDANENVMIKVEQRERSVEEYIPADGSAPTPWVRQTLRSSTGDTQLIQLSRADQQDWEDFQLPLTISGFGGFYQYHGAYFSSFDKPTYKSSLTLGYQNGTEVCAFGTITRDGSSLTQPSDSQKCPNSLFSNQTERGDLLFTAPRNMNQTAR